MHYLIPYVGLDNLRAMIFVDGENLAIRFASHIKKQELEIRRGVVHRPDTFVWSPKLSGRVVEGGGMIRAHYYTAVQGSHDSVCCVESELKTLGIAAPRIFQEGKGF